MFRKCSFPIWFNAGERVEPDGGWLAVGLRTQNKKVRFHT